MQSVGYSVQCPDWLSYRAGVVRVRRGQCHIKERCEVLSWQCVWRPFFSWQWASTYGSTGSGSGKKMPRHGLWFFFCTYLANVFNLTTSAWLLRYGTPRAMTELFRVRSQPLKTFWILSRAVLKFFYILYHGAYIYQNIKALEELVLFCSYW